MIEQAIRVNSTTIITINQWMWGGNPLPIHAETPYFAAFLTKTVILN